MARGNSQNLYLQVSGDVVGLRAAMTAGRTVVNEFGGAAINVIEEVEKEFAKLGSNGLPNLRQVEQSYTDTFKRISQSARAVLDAPTPQAAVQIIDASAARVAAEQASAQAAGLRLVAEAASRADAATGGVDQATRAYATAAATAATNADSEARALRAQANVLEAVENQLGLTVTQHRRSVETSGQARAGYQQLSYQMSDVATQYASGTAASIIFAQQSGQVMQAIGLITNETKGLLGFLGGPWGLAFSSALVVLTPFVGKLLESDDALGKESQSLKDNAEKAAISEQAKREFGRTEAGLIDDVRALTAEIEKQNAALHTNAERLNIRAKNRLELLNEKRGEAVSGVERARRFLDGATRDAEQAMPSEQAGAFAAVDFATRELAKQQARLAAIDRAIAAANAARLATQKDLADERSKRAVDPIADITYKFEGADGLIERAKKRATAEQVINGELDRQLTTLRLQQKTETEIAQKKLSAANKKDPSLGSQLSAERSADLLASAGQYRGLSETKDNGTLQSLLKQGGINVDPKMTAWCAAFVNAVLATNGLPGTGSLSARSFLNYGSKTDAPVKGDIVVSKRGTGGQGHVGFFEGVDAKGNLLVLGGNTGDKVATQKVARSDVLGFRRAPTAANAQQAAEQAARKAEVEADRQTQNRDAYDNLLSRAKADQLQIERSRVTDISRAADLDVAAVQAAQADLDRAAQKGVELGRWTQAEADAATAVTASAAALKIQSIGDRKRIALAQQQFEIDQAAIDDKVALLRLGSELAETAADRRRIARQLLKIEQDQVELALRNQIAAEQDPVRKGILQRRLDQVPDEYAKKGELLDQQNADPLQQYGLKLRKATADLNESLKGVAANGFGTLEDASARAASSAVADLLKIRGVAGEVVSSIISDLVRLAIQKAIVSSIGGSFFGLKDGGPLAGFADGGLPGFAAGGVPSVDRGVIRGPGTGRSDSILALVGGRRPILVSNGEAIVNERGVRDHWPVIDAINKGTLPRFADGGLVAPASFMPRLPSISAARDAMRPQGRMVLDANVTVNAGPEFDARMQSVSIRTVGAAAEPIMAGAQSRTIRKLSRPNLPGGLG